MKLAIGIPHTGTIKAQTVFSLMRALKGASYEYYVIFREGSILPRNRETIVEEAIKHGCTHLLFVDSDMFFEKDAIQRLIDRKVDVVGVDYMTRKHPSESTVNHIPGQEGDLRQVLSVATGFMLIDLSIMKNIKKPWFAYEFNEGEIAKGEDYWFCDRVREATHCVWVDLTIKVGHIGDFIY